MDKLKEHMDQKLEIKNEGPRLKVVRPYYNGLITYPTEIEKNTSAHVVFYNLLQCYEQCGNLSEGIVEDLIWGFRQADIPATITWDGLNNLKKLGFMFFHDGTGRVILGNVSEKLWFRWTLKFIDLLQGEFCPKNFLSKDERVDPKNIDWMEIK